MFGINVMKAVVVHLWTFLHSLLCFVVERALCSLDIRCSSVLSRGLRSGMSGKSVMDVGATGLKWVPGRNGFVREGEGYGTGRQG